MQGAGVLVIDVGGNNIKIMRNADGDRRKTKSGADLTPGAMVKAVRALAHDWAYDRGDHRRSWRRSRQQDGA